MNVDMALNKEIEPKKPKSYNDIVSSNYSLLIIIIIIIIIYAQPRIHPGELAAQSSLGFWDTNRPPNLGQTTRPSKSHKKKKEKKITEKQPNSGLWCAGRPQSTNKRK